MPKRYILQARDSGGGSGRVVWSSDYPDDTDYPGMNAAIDLVILAEHGIEDAMSLAGRVTALEEVNVWYSGANTPSNFFFAVSAPVGSSMAMELVIYTPTGGRVTTAHVLVASDDSTHVQVLASLGTVITPTVSRSGGNINIGCSGSFSPGQLRARGRRILLRTP